MTPAEGLCDDCPRVGHSTDKTRCLPCPRRPKTSALDPAAPASRASAEQTCKDAEAAGFAKWSADSIKELQDKIAAQASALAEARRSALNEAIALVDKAANTHAATMLLVHARDAALTEPQHDTKVSP